MDDTNDRDDTTDATHGEHGGYGDDGSCNCTDGGLGRRAFVGGCGATLALAGGSFDTAAAQETGDVAALLEDLPDNWGQWGDDELGALDLLGSEQAFYGMRAATARGTEGIGRFTLQLPMTGEVINPDPERPDVIFPPEDGSEPTFPSTDTGDPAFPPRMPGRRNNTTPSGGSESADGMTFVDDKFVSDFFLQGTDPSRRARPRVVRRRDLQRVRREHHREREGIRDLASGNRGRRRRTRQRRLREPGTGFRDQGARQGVGRRTGKCGAGRPRGAVGRRPGVRGR